MASTTTHLSVTKDEFCQVNDGFDHLLHPPSSLMSFAADEDFSDSDKDQRCYSLPTTPLRCHRRRIGRGKDCVSENEACKGNNARRRVPSGDNNRRSDEGAAAVVVITRPKGGRRSLCMDLEEVKACHDLGFELEHQKMLEVLPRPSAASNQNLDHHSSSGGNSPISSWRISSPGDDPREVKARLKVWAQAVALISTSQTHN